MHETANKADQSSAHARRRSTAEAPRRRPYVAPRVLSAEPLEAAAATCDPPAGGVGKAAPPCNPSTLGS